MTNELGASVTVLDAKANAVKETVSFAPKGFRLAIAHYNGATLWFPNAKATPEFLEWKGSHLGITVSADCVRHRIIELIEVRRHAGGDEIAVDH